MIGNTTRASWPRDPARIVLRICFAVRLETMKSSLSTSALSLSLSSLLALSLAGCALDLGESGGPSALEPHSITGPLPPTSCGSPEVHVIGVYETHGNHGGCDHPTGDAHVSIERPGNHVLVLSAYEPTSWHVTLAPGVTIQSISLIGYEQQTVDLPGVPVIHGSGCGYSYPYNGGGCDTNQLIQLAEAQAGAPLTSFHGCYQASDWTLHADGSVDSNCNTSAGYQVDEHYGECGGCGGDGGGGGGGGYQWQPQSFPTVSPPTCTGPRYVRQDAALGVWVGAILCEGQDRYKLYMSPGTGAPFFELVDRAGHGQDHCQLVNPAFTLPNEFDITSGGCTTCELGPAIQPNGPRVFARASFGEPFQFTLPQPGLEQSTTFYSCGVSIP
jgi:hypothetical protein